MALCDHAEKQLANHCAIDFLGRCHILEQVGHREPPGLFTPHLHQVHDALYTYIAMQSANSRNGTLP